MPSVKLTKRVIETARPEDRDVILWDTSVKGFGCKVTNKGRKAFILKYRVGGGRGGTMRKPTIGPYGELTVDQARAIARDWLAEIRKGGDPSARRQAERKALKVTDLCDRYLSEHVELHNKPRTVREVRRLVEGRIRPEFGNLKIGEFSRADVSRLHKSMSRTPYEANRVLAALSKMFNLAEVWGLRPDGSNPCRHVQRYRERARERFLNAGELHCLGEALSVVEREAVVPPAVLAVIRFLALTGCRHRSRDRPAGRIRRCPLARPPPHGRHLRRPGRRQRLPGARHAGAQDIGDDGALRRARRRPPPGPRRQRGGPDRGGDGGPRGRGDHAAKAGLKLHVGTMRQGTV